jgi:putative salt-induced outer membrane protein YdiY
MFARRLLLTVCVLAAPLAESPAQTPPPEPPPRLEGTAELAFVGNAGNASTSTFGIGGELTNRTDGWTLKQRASFVRNTSEGDLTAEAVLYAIRSEHALASDGTVAVFGDYGFFRDRFAGVDGRHEATAGLTWRAVSTDSHRLALDAGAGYLNEDRLAGDDVSSASYVTGATYRWRLSPAAELTNETRLTGTFDRSSDWRVIQNLAVTAQLTNLLALKVGAVVRFANLPAAGFKRTDTTTSVALVAKFRRPAVP